MRYSLFMRSVAPVAAVLALISCALAALAQAGQKPPDASRPAAGGKSPAAPPVTPKVVVPSHPSNVHSLNDEDIVLSPGDIIQIQVENHPALDGLFPIPGVGKLLLPEAGEVLVAGFTIGQVRDSLQAQLDKTLNNVFVRVLLREVHSRRASISGVVLHQGSFDMGTNEYRLLDLIDLAGGLAPPTYRQDAKLSEFTGTLYRGTVTVAIDIVGAYKQPDGAANFVIQPNDRVSVEIRSVVTHEVHILGQIPRQGAYTLDNNTTVLGLFGQAGYPNTTSSLSTAYVLRGSQKIPLDLRPLLTGNVDLAINKFKFEDGDILFIPAVTTQYMVWGQVGRQGNYPYPEAGKINLLDAIQIAGESPAGDFKQVHVIRTVDGKQKDQTINVDLMIRKGVLKDNVALQPNDIVFVPPKPRRGWKPSIQDLFTPLMFMNILGLRPF